MTAPALTPEEWADYSGPYCSGHHVRDCDICFGQLDNHQRAALALDGQPFGFTREDVGLIVSLCSVSEVKGERFDAAMRLAGRINALLRDGTPR